MKKYLFFFAFFVHFGILSQVSFGIKIGGLAVHHQKVDPNYYRLSIDKKGRFVGYLGVSFVATYHINQYIGVKFIQTIMPFDCAGKRSGITHLGIDFQDRIIGIQNSTHQLSASFGPLIYYRKNWNQVANYTPNDQFVKRNKKGIGNANLFGMLAKFNTIFLSMSDTPFQPIFSRDIHIFILLILEFNLLMGQVEDKYMIKFSSNNYFIGIIIL